MAGPGQVAAVAGYNFDGNVEDVTSEIVMGSGTNMILSATMHTNVAVPGVWIFRVDSDGNHYAEVILA